MVGASITVTDAIPALNKKVIYFSVTLDGSAKADFSAYKSVDFVSAVDEVTLVPEPVTAYSVGGDVTFTNNGNAIKGIAVVNL